MGKYALLRIVFFMFAYTLLFPQLIFVLTNFQRSFEKHSKNIIQSDYGLFKTKKKLNKEFLVLEKNISL